MLAGTSNRPAATESAFLVGIPTMYAASAYQLYSQFKQGGGHEHWSALVIAFVVSIITAFIAVNGCSVISNRTDTRCSRSIGFSSDSRSLGWPP
jgi:undecaprenyl pyrophosphate phosphatase UppP